jgi:hypothetical protein
MFLIRYIFIKKEKLPYGNFDFGKIKMILRSAIIFIALQSPQSHIVILCYLNFVIKHSLYFSHLSKRSIFLLIFILVKICLFNNLKDLMVEKLVSLKFLLNDFKIDAVSVRFHLKKCHLSRIFYWQWQTLTPCHRPWTLILYVPIFLKVFGLPSIIGRLFFGILLIEIHSKVSNSRLCLVKCSEEFYRFRGYQ